MIMRLIILGTTVALITTASAEPMLLPKTGQCPSGYRDSGGYCAPMNDKAPVAVPKQGQCPSGFMQSGNYCISTQRR
jgi:hypothetical protein